jgi:hypothetical protein
MGLIFLFLISISSSIQPLLSQTIYFPGKMEDSLRRKITACESKPISKFEYKQSDFYQESLKKTFSIISKRSKMEGKTRMDSIQCLHKLKLSKDEKKLVSSALQDLFDVEILLYQNYLKWIQAELGLDAKSFESFFQSRYDLMILIQTKTLSLWKSEDPDDLKDGERDLSNLYQSVHRSYFDVIYGLDPVEKERYFQIKEGKKQ